MISQLLSPVTPLLYSACFLRLICSSDSVPIGGERILIWIRLVLSKIKFFVSITCPCGTDLFSAINRITSTPYSTTQFTSLASSAVHHHRIIPGFHHASSTNPSEARHQIHYSSAGYKHRSMIIDLPSAPSPSLFTLNNHHLFPYKLHHIGK